MDTTNTCNSFYFPSYFKHNFTMLYNLVGKIVTHKTTIKSVTEGFKIQNWPTGHYTIIKCTTTLFSYLQKLSTGYCSWASKVKTSLYYRMHIAENSDMLCRNASGDNLCIYIYIYYKIVRRGNAMQYQCKLKITIVFTA